MRAIVIYDATGRIWNIIYGEDTLPQGLMCMFVDIPDGAQLERIDVTNPDDPQPVFTYLPESDIGRLQKEMSEVQEQIAPITPEFIQEVSDLKDTVDVLLLSSLEV